MRPLFLEALCSFTSRRLRPHVVEISFASRRLRPVVEASPHSFTSRRLRPSDLEASTDASSSVASRRKRPVVEASCVHAAVRKRRRVAISGEQLLFASSLFYFANRLLYTPCSALLRHKIVAGRYLAGTWSSRFDTYGAQIPIYWALGSAIRTFLGAARCCIHVKTSDAFTRALYAVGGRGRKRGRHTGGAGECVAISRERNSDR